MVHVKYPSMERQDLTQSQLGSFKFTPVDEAVPGSHPHPLLLQQYHSALQASGFLNQSVHSPDVTSDPSFFNQQIRPSLDTSRLRLGPAAVRAAVESASTSPKKRFGRRAQEAMRPNAQAFHPHFIGSENESIHSFYTSEGNTAPLSMATNDSIAHSSFDFSNANASVLRALESEQIAHEATKAKLERETAARHEAEIETMRLVECNKGLINSINLLKSTVRHMVQKESDTVPDPANIDHVVKEYHKDVQTHNSNGSILYGVLSNYETTQMTMKDGEESISTFNLDLLNTPDANDKSEKAQLQRTLRRQMGLSSDAEEVANLKSEYQQKIESIVRGDETLLPDFPTMNTPKDDHPVSSDIESARVLGGDTVQDDIQPDTASRNPMLELPASFLSKYTRTKDALEEEGLSPIDTPKKTNLTSLCAIKPRQYNMDNNTAPKSTKLIWMPDTPMIDWKIDNRHRDELRGKIASIQTRTTDSQFVDYPLRYIPNVLEDNLYRTIMIDFIPFGTPYSDVLQQIRGGALEVIQMYGPIGNATDFVTARVIYTDENGATAMYRRGQDPGIKINGSQVRVWQILEATYPKNKELEEAVYVHGHTRILVVHASMDNINDLLKRKLRSQIEAGLVLDIGRTHDGVPMVEFTSIEQSTRALKAFLDDRDFAGCDFDFEDDYCNSRFPDDVKEA